MPAIGVTTVRCPVCRAAVGRPCHNRRGYLTDAHEPRVTLWVAQETREAREALAPSGPHVAGRDSRLNCAV